MISFKKQPATLLMLCLLCLLTCQTKENTEQLSDSESGEKHLAPTTDTIQPYLDSSGVIADRLIAKDSTKVTEESNTTELDFPLLVIENCGALWRKECQLDSAIKYHEIVALAQEFYAKEPLVSIGTKGVIAQEIRQAYCMRGECGGHQVALALSAKECLGVLAPARIISELGDFKPLIPIEGIGLTAPMGLPKADSSFLESIHYVDADTSFGFQLAGKGYIQENQWPMFKDTYLRIIAKKAGVWTSVSSWQSIDLKNVTTLVRPIAFTLKENSCHLIWWARGGICCPSASQTWLSKIEMIDDAKLRIENGEKYLGGFGQPCD